MNQEAEIAALKARVDILEDEVILLYESLNKRIDDMQASKSQKLTIWGIIVAIIVGGIQIAIALFSNK